MANGSAYLGRTISSGSTTTKATFSCWLRRCDVTSNIYHGLFGMKPASSSNEHLVQILLQRNSVGAGIQVAAFDSSGNTSCNKRTERALRDLNAWYHIVVTLDTTLATAEDRCKIYINGERETDFVSGVNTNFDQNDTIGYFNNHSNNQQLVGAFVFTGTTTITNKLNGSLTHVHACDGYAYQASSFGETDATTGIWKPITSPTVNYGTNGFFLKMENSANMGLDSSGNSNSLTTNGTIIQTKDTPTNNTATWDALNTGYTGATFANANNTLNTGTSNYTFNISNIGLDSGKWYWETKYVSTTASGGTAGLIGIASVHNTGSTDWLGQQSTNYGYYSNDGKIRNNSAWSTYGNSYAVGDIIGCALDLENNKLYFSKNGTWQNSGDPTSGSTGTGAVSITDPASTFLGCYFAAAGDYDSGKSYQFAINFGDGKFGTTSITSAGSNGNGSLFEYDVPSGYYAVNIKNMAGNS